MNPDSRTSDPELDRRFMAAALRVGRRNLGSTFPNPAVGALVVRPDVGAPRVVGRGWTAIGGRPHAEIQALAEAGEAATGATAYVTLEPCAHTGHTPACAQALIDAGINRLVTTIPDPDPRVAGKGLAMMKAAGLDVLSGVLAADALVAHGGHIRRITENRPWITLKLAISADGMIGRRDGERMMVTGKAAFGRVQAIRAEHDAIMVGIGTVEVDDPRLTIRVPVGNSANPIRIVLDTAARISHRTRLVQSSRETPLWIMVGDDADHDRVAALEAAGAIVHPTPIGAGGLDLPSVFARLAEEGLTRVLVEGGSKVAASLVSAGLLDQVLFLRAPVVIGPDGVRALDGQALSAIERSPRFNLIDEGMIGEDRVRSYLRAA